MIRKNLVYLVLILSIVSCATKPENASQPFVKVNDMHFEINGKPYYFGGVNMWYASYLGATPEGRKRLVKELDTLKSIGLTNIRILGASEKSDLLASIKTAIQTGPGVYNENLLEGLDYTLAEMAKRNMKAVIFLNNYWQWSGGMSQYVNWTTGKKIVDPDEGNDWSGFMRYSATFYSNPKAIELNKKFITALITRTNTITGKKYIDDPTIMAWELSNEPRPGTDGDNGKENMSVFIDWIYKTAAYIHSLDSNHLVTTGTEGTVGCIKNAEYFLKVHNCKDIDYVNLHLWPKNWGWFKANNITGTLDSSKIKALAYINLHISLARQLHKPITLEEFGLDRDNGELLPGTAITARDSYFSAVFNLISDSAVHKSPLVGWNLWSWGGFGTPHPTTDVTTIPQAFVGDPLCEPQGLNSVYVSDTSTIRIIRKNIEKLQSIN